MSKLISIGFLFLILIFGVFLLVISLVQMFLSKTKSKSFGLILPIISAIFSFIIPASISGFTRISIIQRIIQFIIVFLITNILTGILTAIYIACRKKIEKNKEIDKMNIQDLN